LELIAVCDHNSAGNVEAVQKAGRRWGLVVLPGMEITSAEEVHTLGIFRDLRCALEVQESVEENLPEENIPEVFGYQVLMDEEDRILGSEDRLLAGATRLTLDEVVEVIHGEGGVAIASHVDREYFGLLGQLGMIPEGLPLDGVEISWRTTLSDARSRFPHLGHWTMVRGSDAHTLEEVGRAWTRLLVAEASFEELRLALMGAKGRRVLEGE